jgi:OmpA family/WD40-like Beta Propeller Repeat
VKIRGAILSVCCLLLAVAAAGQSKKGNKFYLRAVRYKAARQPDKACRTMEHAINKNPDFPDAYSQLAQWYFEAHRFSAAAEVLKKGSDRCKNGARRFAKPLARCYLYAGQPGSALYLISNYATEKDSTEWGAMRRQAYFIEEAQAAQTTDWPVNLGERINTADPELFPSIAMDTQELYFTRRVNNMDEDLYMARADSCGGWFKALAMGTPPNSPDQESAMFVSADGHYMFFTRCENRSVDGWAEGGCDLFIAYRTTRDSDWSIAQPFGATINTFDYEGMPALSPDNKELYFVSNRKGGYGGYDIWLSRFEDGLWQEPVNAGPDVNTAGDETAPYVALDGKTLYFTSNGWPGMGGTDLFVSKRRTDNGFDKPVNLGYPINTACDEKSVSVSSDGRTIFFASDRNGPAGNYDIYRGVLPHAVRPMPVSYMEGVVYDSITKNRLNYAAICVRNAFNGDTVCNMRSNRGDASFMITLELGHTYTIHTARLGFTDVEDTVVFDNCFLLRPMVHDVVMLPSDYQAPVYDSLLDVIHYDVNRVGLTDDEMTVLRNAIGPWLDSRKAFIIYVNAYTDNTGTPMINEELSTKRAATIARILGSMGVDEGSIRAKGWGEAKMIATNETEEGQRQNRRVEIVISH